MLYFDAYFNSNIGYEIDEEYRGNGYAYEAVAAFLDFLFDEKSARRIYIYTEDYNMPY